MKQCLFAFLFLISAPSLLAQANPLATPYKPSIDCSSGDYPSNVSLTNDLAKLRQTNDSPTSIAGYGTTPLPCLTVYGTQNEIVSFQAHYQDTGAGTSNFSVTLSNLVKSTGPGGNYTISASSTDIVVYREWYIPVTTPDNASAPNFLTNTPVISSTATSGTTGTAYYCSTCNFTTSGVTSGMWLWDENVAGNSNGYVASSQISAVNSATELTLTTSLSGSASGDTFAIYQIQYDPDPLIPVIDPYYNQTTSAYPMTVAANNNQSTWFDVYIPSAAPSGWYSGTVTLKTGATTIATLPVLLAVWKWPTAYGGYMPSTATLGSVFASPAYGGLCHVAEGSADESCTGVTYSGQSGDSAVTLINIDAAVQMLDNRLSSDAVSNIYPQSGSFSTYNSDIGPLLSGTSAHVTGIVSGEALTSILVNLSGSFASNGATFLNFGSNFNTEGWLSKLFYYSCDEPPNGCSWSTVTSQGNTLHTSSSYEPPIIPALVTTNYADANTNSALSDIDWMIATVQDMEPLSGGNQRSTYSTWLSGNCCGAGSPTRHVGIYNDCLSAPCGGHTTYGYTTYVGRFIDQLPVSNTAMETSDWEDQVSYELYFAQDICDTDDFCGYSDAVANPWQVPNYGGVWGDGTLLYPCGTEQAPCASLTTPIWCPSIRLKLTRDGIQQYEYYNLLANEENQSSTVSAEIGTWYTNAYCYNVTATASSTESWTNCSQSFTGDITDARTALGNAMQSITYPAYPTNPGKTGMLMARAQ